MFKILLPFFLLLAGPARFSPADKPYKTVDPRLELLKKQVIKDILSAPVNETELMNLAGEMKQDGSWPDINYADKTRGGWPVNDHLVRLNNMAVLYTRLEIDPVNKQKLESKIIAGLNFWLKNDFICPNWWYPEIGVPKVLGPTMLLMEAKLSPKQKEAGIKILNRARIGMTGQNKVWLSGNVVYRSLLTGNVDSIQAAVKSIQEEVIISEGEGIQADYSFHQHGPQQQFGNYGASYAADMLKWATIFQNTAFQFDAEKIEILHNYLLQGMRWVIWKNKMDISACGRQLFPDAQAAKAKGIERVFKDMPLVDASFEKEYVKETNRVNEDKHFWRSDMTIHRRENFYTSVKMSSHRVAGAESCNDENIQGYHLGDGATYFYQSGEEYTDIFPFWDWKRIPGTTTYHDAAPLPVLPCSGYRIASDFVGGVSDGSNGVATLCYNRDSLNAQKSWFYFDDATVCLGAGISSMEEKEVTTTINQSFLHGNVLVKQGATPKVVEAGKHDLAYVSWLIHDNWGYYFPAKTNIEIANRQQSGDWHHVLKRMPSKEMKANLFTLWINHHTRPEAARYAYYVFPAATAENIDAKASGIELRENSDKLQLIESTKKQMAGFVFVKAGEATTKTFNKVSADRPCVMMITKNGGSPQITLSDPTHLQTSIVIGFQGKKKSQAFYTVKLPQGPEAGKSVSLKVD